MVLVVYFLLFFGSTMPVPLALEAWSPNYWTTSEILVWEGLDGVPESSF